MSDAKLNTETAQHLMPKAISEMSAPQPVELRTGEREQSQFNVPGSYSLSQKIIMEERRRKKTEELRGEEEEKEKMENSQQMQNNTALPKQRQDSAGLKISTLEREIMNRGRKRDLISIERQRADLEISLMRSRSEIIRLNKAITAETRHVKLLERLIERENHHFEEFFKRSEKKSVEAKTLFEKESKSKQEKNAAIETLNDEIGTIKSELAKMEEILNEYKRYKNILFKLSPSEWQETQEDLQAEVLSDAADEQNREPQSSVRQGLECEESSPGKAPSSTREPRLSSAHSHTLVTNSKPDSDNSGHEEKLELYFSDPQQLLDLVMDLTEQNLSLIQNSTRRDETLEELRQIIEVTRKKMKEDEEKLTLQINDMKERIEIEQERSAKVKQKVQLHVSLKTEDEDVMLDALSMKVTEVHCCSVDSQLTNLSTLEKLSSVEYRMSLLLQQIESIPEESLEILRQLKESERRSRMREEQLRLEREQQRERMKKCMERSLGDSKKIRGRKLRPRCIPVEQKIKVSDEDNIPAEDELHAYLFTTEDIE